MSKGTSKVNDHANIAERFEILAENLISIRTVYERKVPKSNLNKNRKIGKDLNFLIWQEWLMRKS